MRFIDGHKVRSHGGLRWGVESMCQVLTEHGLPIAPATYYAAKAGPPSLRVQRDEQRKLLIAALQEANYGVYGVPRCLPRCAATASTWAETRLAG